MNPPVESRGAVLIADDEEFVRHGLAALLQRDGFLCTIAASGTEALARLQEQEFDAVISDIHMPGNVRLEAVATIRRVAPTLPIVLLTGRPSVETAAQAVRLPVTAYLTKPPDMDELVGLLDAAIRDHRGFRAVQAGRVRLKAWEQELDEIERQLRAAGRGGEAGAAMGSFLRLSLRQVILTLLDLERASGVLERAGQTTMIDQEAALRRTVEVLERTRQNFKSKDLADLRRQLEGLLGSSDENR